MTWRESETRVISVTPVARGLVRPALLAMTLVVLVQLGAFHSRYVHRHEALFLLVVVGPVIVVVATRAWRWRSHKIHVTTERIIVEGGVVRHFRSSVELRHVLTTRVEQRVSERLARRGTVLLETAAGTFHVGRVRHPAALCRLVDRERSAHQSDRVPFDTVFEFEDPTRHEYEVNSRRRWGRQ